MIRDLGAVELVVDAHARVGEGPLWDQRSNRLLWTDVLGGFVHEFDPTTDQEAVTEVGQPVGAIATRLSGGYVAAVRDGFATLDLASGELGVFAEVELNQPTNRMNDGKCDAAGRFWAGTMADDAGAGRGALYRLEANHQVTKVLNGTTISNGLDWSPDASRMYYIDTGLDRIDAYAFDLATGEIEPAGTTVAFDPADGRPDGMAVDAEGFLWVALVGGWCVRRYHVSGRLDREVFVPARLVTSCAFGGHDLGDLYITTAGYDVKPDDSAQPHAGGLFRFRPGVSGLAPNLYRG
jgi:sugar lactone lactonase YvrE